MQKSIRGEISTLIAMGFLAVMAVAAIVTTTLNQEPQDQRAKATETPQTCNYDSGQNVPLGSTESNTNNMENRWPISQHRHEYDIFGLNYYVLKSNPDPDVLSLTKEDGGTVDSKMKDFMGSMFGYKPTKLSAAYDVFYGGSVPQGKDTNIKGNAPVLKIPTTANVTEIKVPSTSYDIGGGYEAMVVFAAEDRVTIHIGRHEYFVGTPSGKNCNGGECSGGYWIYVKDICVDKRILNAYNSVKNAQEAAGADKSPIQLPMVKPGQTLGKATGASVIVGVRDNGPFISTSKPVYWEGVPTVTSSQPAATPTTNTPTLSRIPTPQTTTGQGSANDTPAPTPTATGPPQKERCPNTNLCVTAPVECEGEGAVTNTPPPTRTPTTTTTTPTSLPSTSITQSTTSTVSLTQTQNTNTPVTVSITNSSNNTFTVQQPIETVGQLVDFEGLNVIIISSI
jgi:hypothetical protein